MTSAFGIGFQHALARESWGLFSVGILFIIVRLGARVRKLGWNRLQLDDYLMMIAACFYILLIVCLNLIAQSAGSALAFPGEDVMALPESEIKARELGSKIDLLAEVGMLNTIWVLKSCMLVFYYRLTQGMPGRQLAVKLLAVYVAMGWVACQLAFFLECRPFHAYWQIAPSPNLSCMTLWTYAIVQCTFNISSDVIMLLIPLPMVLAVNVPLKQKAVLSIIFSMGVFVITAALLTKIFFFTDVYSADYMFWYTREASVAVYVANLPCIWPLLREFIPVLKSWTPGGVSSGTRSRRGSRTAASHLAIRSTPMGNIGLSRRSMEEFQQIVDNHNRSSNPSIHAGVDPKAFDHTEPLPSSGFKWQRSRSSDSSFASDEENLGRIRVETTTEMNVVDTGSRAGADEVGSKYGWA